MENERSKRRVLVISSDAELTRSAAALLGDEFSVLEAADEKSGWTGARESRPDAILLGYLEPRGAAFRLHSRLRSGWITKHIPLVVADTRIAGQPDRGWTPEEAMRMEAEEYLSVSADSGTGLREALGAAGLARLMRTRLRGRANLLKEAILDPEVFCVTWEQIPGRGAFEVQQEKVFENVARAAAGGKVHGISVTDNPGGNPALSTEMLCAEIKKSGMEPLVHMACRDKNRNMLESMLYGVAAEGVRNVLVLSGDYPSTEGFGGMPKPVYDMDPVNVLRLVEVMNAGLQHNVTGKTVTLAPTDFFAGACVSPFKILESELMTQYAKLHKKIGAGARFIVTQVGYDARKLHELLQWLAVHGYSIPVIANVYVLPYGAAKLMNANGVAGCVVTDKLLAEIDREKAAEDKGKAARLLRAARQYAVAKGMKCAGAHIGGHGLTYDMVQEIVDRGEELAPRWQDLVAELDYPQANGFYYFEKDERSGLNTDRPAARLSRPRAPLVYRFARLAHALLFDPEGGLFRLLRPLAAALDRSPRAKRRFGRLEHLAKAALFGCQNCGDCALFDVAYVCPMSQCPKQQRNGPCGGSHQGWCEVHPGERRCVWVQAYDRLKAYGEQGSLEEVLVPPCDWRLYETPSWLNFYLGRDHTARRLGIEPPVPRGSVAAPVTASEAGRP